MSFYIVWRPFRTKMNAQHAPKPPHQHTHAKTCTVPSTPPCWPPRSRPTPAPPPPPPPPPHTHYHECPCPLRIQKLARPLLCPRVDPDCSRDPRARSCILLHDAAQRPLIACFCSALFAPPNQIPVVDRR